MCLIAGSGPKMPWLLGRSHRLPTKRLAQKMVVRWKVIHALRYPSSRARIRYVANGHVKHSKLFLCALHFHVQQSKLWFLCALQSSIQRVHPFYGNNADWIRVV
jgi:hypothetical protein